METEFTRSGIFPRSRMHTPIRTYIYAYHGITNHSFSKTFSYAIHRWSLFKVSEKKGNSFQYFAQHSRFKVHSPIDLENGNSVVWLLYKH